MLLEHPGSLCAPPRAGKNSYPGGREPTLPQVPPVLHVCVMQGPQQPVHDDGLLPKRSGEEATSPGGVGGKGGG